MVAAGCGAAVGADGSTEKLCRVEGACATVAGAAGATRTTIGVVVEYDRG
ncbi:MAG: hypothetical protein K1X74_01125 [Pirellulales bacterium]|nr:hypothetical protein [Pirellulales bacterium]